MTKTPQPAGYDEIQREELSRLFGALSHVRLAVAPVVFAFVVWILTHPVVPWRRGVLVTLGVAAFGFFVHEVVHHRRFGLGRRAFIVNFAFAVVGQALASLATGGLESPFLFAMFPLAMVAAVMVEAPAVFIMVAVQAVEVWTMAWIAWQRLLPNLNPGWFGGDARPGWNHTHLVWTAVFATAGLGVVTFLGRGIRYSFNRMLRRGLEARHEVLRAHRDRAQELSALSGEIAHELKNPLASIKGLSALLAHDAPAGKPAERLAVLRREVDRMQAILEEFLNFSRPLVPLSIESVDVRTLLDEVADMHEGMAHERNVRLLVNGVEVDALTIRCDPRKMKQALTNLVQNALEASPTDSTVELASDAGGEVCLRVLDRGPGLDGEIAGRAFDAGVTTKARGSGLGLTIARALLRQHGGDLELAARPGGGCVATARLPRKETNA
jgi:two-component system sensor histidine kinase HydH